MTASYPCGFAFALIYGQEVDCFNNLKATGYGKLKRPGIKHILSIPHLISMQKDSVFLPFKWTMFKGIRLDDYNLTDASILGSKTEF